MFSSSRSSFRVPGIGTIQFLCERPGERDLRGRGAFPLGDALQQFDHRHVCGARVRCKARRDAAEVGAAEGRARIDRAGQKTRTKRTKRTKPIPSSSQVASTPLCSTSRVHNEYSL